MSHRQGRLGGAGGEVTFDLVVDTTRTEADMQRLITRIEIVERTLVSTLSLMQRLTGDENISRGIQVMMRMIALVNQLQLASNLLMATNPWLWPLGALGLVTTTVSFADTLKGY